MEKSEMIDAVGQNTRCLMVNQVNVTPNLKTFVAQNGATAEVIPNIVIALLVSIINFWANDGMPLVWKFHYLV